MVRKVYSYKYIRYTSAFCHIYLIRDVTKALQDTSNLSQYYKCTIATGLVEKSAKARTI